jgi:beta-glucosidase
MAQTWLQRLLQADRLHALVIYGSPYILEQLRPHLPGDVPYVFSYGQMPVAQTIALETLLNHSDPELQIESVGDRRFTD